MPEDWEVVCFISVYKERIKRRISIFSLPGNIYGRALVNRILNKTRGMWWRSKEDLGLIGMCASVLHL